MGTSDTALHDAARPDHVLVAEDDEDVRSLIARALRRAGYTVEMVPGGEEALAHLREHRPGLLLLDLNMPGKNGLAVCEAVQELGLLAPPVIFLTAQSDTASKVSGLDAGAVDYIVKPFDPAELVARVRAALRTKERRDWLARAAIQDGLTGVATRQHLDQRAAELVALARRHHRPLACLMVDVDYFKQVNDSHGHAAGDAVLRALAQQIRRLSRATDVVGRYGGEEFTLLLPETDLEGARLAAEKIRVSVAAHSIQLPTDAPGGTRPMHLGDDGAPAPTTPPESDCITVTVSIGVAPFQEDMPNAEVLYQAADRALYQAKRRGRNQVVVEPRAAPAPV